MSPSETWRLLDQFQEPPETREEGIGMASLSDEIRNKQFTVTRVRAGYDQDEVDDFLDRIADQHEGTEDDLKRALDDNLRLRRMGSDTPTQVMLPVQEPPSYAASKLLERAQDVHDQVIEEGRAAAQVFIDEARQQSASIISDAHVKREEVERLGQAKFNEKIGELESVRAKLESQIDQLKELRQRYVGWANATVRKFNETIESSSDLGTKEDE